MLMVCWLAKAEAVAGGDAGVPAGTRPPLSLRGKNSAVDVESWVEEKGLSSQGWGDLSWGWGVAPGLLLALLVPEGISCE